MLSMLDELVMKTPILLEALRLRDNDTYEHSLRVGKLAEDLAFFMKLPFKQCRYIGCMGCLHDVGKIAVPDAILLKPGKLTDEEYEQMKRHSHEGSLLCIKVFGVDLPGVTYHHERWDSRGYPHQVGGDEIPIEARIVSVTDAFDAMTADRPYRAGMDPERAIAILREGAGAQWDPVVVRKFIEMWEVRGAAQL